MPGELAAFNTTTWETGDYVADYAGDAIATVEALLLLRYRDDLRGPVLELGCGAGRLTRLLADLSSEVLALDVSPRMVRACRLAVPAARVELGDLRDLSAIPSASAGAVVGGDNVLDVLGDDDRRAALASLQRILRPDGLLLFESHNRAHIPFMGRPTHPLGGRPEASVKGLLRLALNARRAPERAANRRRTRAFERDEPGYAIVNDGAHDNRLVHYHIGRDAQERQLADAGFVLLECLDRRGGTVPPGQAAPQSSALHYVARRAG